MEEKIKALFPEANFEILEYSNPKMPLKIKCLHCGKIREYKMATGILNRINFCDCQKQFNNTKEKILWLIKTQNKLNLIEYQDTMHIIVECKECGRQWLAKSSTLLRGGDCKCQQKLAIFEVQQRIDNEFGNETYSLLQYNGINKKNLIFHKKCQKVFSQSIAHFLDGGGCPFCYRKRSKGETKIAFWLKEHNIDFITQYTIQIGNQNYYADFYIPIYNCIIEYQGEQHYHPVKNFGGISGYEATKKRDEIKLQYYKSAEYETLYISYQEFSNISSILSSKFND